MRKLFLLMNISLDGYFDAPGNDISGFTNDFEAFSQDGSQQVDTLLFGHNTYDMMKFWSTPQAQEVQPDVTRFMNTTPKIVASHHLFDPGWSNVTVFSGDVPAQVKALKAQPGHDILIMGSNTLCVSLMQHGLIDEFQILVNPVVFGEGTSLFTGLPQKTNLTLTGSRRFKSGVNMLIYVPVHP